MKTDAGLCESCDAMCCRYVATEIDKPTCKRDYDHIRWYLQHRSVNVFIDHHNRWFLEFETPCEALNEDGRCGIYAERPDICRQHGVNDETVCEFHGDEPPHKIKFQSAREFEQWLEKRKINWRFKSHE